MSISIEYVGVNKVERVWGFIIDSALTNNGYIVKFHGSSRGNIYFNLEKDNAHSRTYRYHIMSKYVRDDSLKIKVQTEYEEYLILNKLKGLMNV